MIDFSSTVVELSGDSEKQKEVQDIAKCLRTLYSTPIGSQEGDRELGINPNIFVDKPLPVAKGLYVAEVTHRLSRGQEWCGWTGWTVMCCMAL